VRNDVLPGVCNDGLPGVRKDVLPGVRKDVSPGVRNDGFPGPVVSRPATSSAGGSRHDSTLNLVVDSCCTVYY
jgi:hypothetical protein